MARALLINQTSQAFDFNAAQSSIVGLPVDINASAQPQITSLAAC